MLILSLVIGLIGWFIPDISNSPEMEFPNSLPQGLYIDSNGNIFCGSQSYERIQMYDKYGVFIRSFSTDVGKGRGSLFAFNIENDQLHIHVFGAWLKSERIDRKIVYSLDGNLVEATDMPSTEYAGYNPNNEFTDSFGNYFIFKGFCFPRVIKKENGNSDVIINTPLYQWFFQSPFPSFAFFFIPLLILAGPFSKAKLFKKRMQVKST